MLIRGKWCIAQNFSFCNWNVEESRGSKRWGRVCPILKDFLLGENTNLGILSFKWIGNNLSHNNTIPAIGEKILKIIHPNKLFSFLHYSQPLSLCIDIKSCVLLFFFSQVFHGYEKFISALTGRQWCQRQSNSVLPFVWKTDLVLFVGWNSHRHIPDLGWWNRC